MGIPYDAFTGAFLNKISEFELLRLDDNNRAEMVDGYRKRALNAFRKNCLIDLYTTGNDEERFYDVEVDEADMQELVDIVSTGMVVQWLQPYVYQQENLQNVLNTRDYSLYSPAELLRRIGDAYAAAQKEYIQMIREYSYNHGDLTVLHL